MSAINKINELYWFNKLSGVEENFTFEKFCTGIDNVHGCIEQQLSALLNNRLLDIARQQDLNVFKIIAAVIQVVQQRYFYDRKLVLQLPYLKITGYSLTEHPIYFCSRLKLNDQWTFRKLLQQLHDELLQDLQHAAFDHADLLHKMKINGSGDIAALNEWAFSYTPLNESKGSVTAKIHLTLTRIDRSFKVSVVYDTTCIPDFIASGIVRHVINILESVTRDIDIPLARLDILTSDEIQQLTTGFNNNKTTYSDKTTIIRLFEEQVKATPHLTALVDGDKRLSYEMLEQMAGRICGYLIDHLHCKPGTLVGVLAENSAFAIIAILGILKAGGIFIPIDVRHGVKRAEDIISEAKGIVLSTPEWQEDFQNIAGINYIDPDSLPGSSLSVKREASDFVYSIFTSGTTGKPKGALVYHHSLINHVSWFKRTFEISERDSSIMINSFSFDLTMTLMWSMLTSGGTLHLVAWDIFDPELIVTYMQERQITSLKTPPSTLRALIASEGFKKHGFGEKFRVMQCGGEPVDSYVLGSFMNSHPNAVLSNHYGITETSIGSTCILVTKENITEFDRFALIGFPYDNISVYILDQEFRLMPCGNTGEIFIGGAGVGGGYLNQPELTSEKFIENPFLPGERMYRTGDFGRWHPDGKIEFICRKDDQVKVNGYRIELKEIRSRIMATALVQDCVVVKQTKSDTGDELVAYIELIPHKQLPVVISAIREQLPTFMKLARVVPVSSIPITLNGKVNVNALKALDVKAVEKFNWAQGTSEKRLYDLWVELLGHNQFDSDCDFFDIGGNSLRAIQLVTRINLLFHIKVSIRDIFLNASFTKQIEIIDQKRTVQAIQIVNVPVEAVYPVSHVQKRLWLIAQGQQGNNAVYNISHAFLINTSLEETHINKAFECLLQRHESLRTTFVTIDTQPKQKIADRVSCSLVWHDLQNEVSAWDKALQLINKLAATPFDLSIPPLCALKVFKLGPEKFILQFVIHHIVSDGWSMQILIRDFLVIYEDLRRQKSGSLSPLAIQYKDFTAWHNHWVNSAASNEDRLFWAKELQGKLPMLPLATDEERPSVKSGKGALATFVIPPVIVSQLLQIAKQQQPSGGLVLALSVALLHVYTGQEEIIIGMPFAGRSLPGLEDQVGAYINTLPLRLRFSAKDSFHTLLEICKQQIITVAEHEMLPLDVIVEELNKTNGTNAFPLFNVAVSYNNFDISINEEHQFPVQKVERVPFHQKTSKFDLSFHYYQTPGGLTVGIEYDTDIFLPQRMTTLNKHLVKLMEEVTMFPNKSLGQISVLDEWEEKILGIINTVLKELNQPPVLFTDNFIVDKRSDEVLLAISGALEEQLSISLSAGDLYLFPNAYALVNYIRNMAPEKLSLIV